MRLGDRASRFLIGLVAGFATHGGIPAQVGALVDELPLVSSLTDAAAITSRRMRGTTGSRPLWWPPAKLAGRHLAPYLATARPSLLEPSTLTDRAASRPRGEELAHQEQEAMELALLLADQDARCGDYRQALHALDLAAAVGGGVFPRSYDDKRERWSRMLSARSTHDDRSP